MADIESLELQITGDSKSAKDGLDALIATLDTLKLKTQGGAGLSAIAKPISSIAAASKNLTGSEGAKIKSLADGLNALSNLGNLKLSSSVAHQIDAMGRATASLSGVDFAKLTELSTSLQSFNGIGKSGMGSILTQLERIPNVMAELTKADLTGFGEKIRQIAKDMKPLADEMQKVANGFAAFPAQIQKFMASSSSVPTANGKSALSFANLASKIVATMYTIKRVARVIASWISKSSKYTENLNLFSVSMGKYANSAMEYADKVSDAMGIDTSEWIRNQGVFMTLATGFGIVGDRAAKMSEQLTQLGYDISSYFDISVEEAMQKLKSGFAGELEPLRNLGYDLSQAKLEVTALSLGIGKSVSSMTQAEKASLRYYAIMTQVTQVQGDLARTLDEPANQLRILRAQIGQAARALGNIFIPILNKVLPYLIAFAKVVRIVANIVAGLFGFSFPEVDDSGISDAETGSGDISENLDEAADNAAKLKKVLLGIDELNVMPDVSGGAGEDIGGGGFDFDIPEYDFIGEATENRVNQIVESMKEWLGIGDDITTWSELMDTRFGNILKSAIAIGVAIAAWKVAAGTIKAIDSIKKLAEMAGGGGILAGIGGGILGLLGGFIEIQGIIDAIKNGLDGFNFAEILGGGGALAGGGALIGKALGSAIIGGAIGGIVAGIPAFIAGIYDAIVNGIDWLSGALIGLGATAAGAGIGALIGSVGGPLGALIGFLVGIVVDGIILIVQNWETIGPWLAEMGAKIGEFFSDVWKDIKGIWNKVTSWFNKQVIRPILGLWEDWWKGVARVASDCWNAISEVFSPVVKWFGELFGSVYQTVSDIFYNIGVIASGCWEIIKAVWAIVSSWFSTTVIQPVSTFFTDLWNGIKTRAINAWEGIKTTFASIRSWINTTIIQPVGNLFSGLWSGFLSKAVSAWEGIKTTFSKVGSFFKTTFQEAWQGVVNIFSVAGEIFVDIKDGILAAFKKIVNSLISGLNKVIAIPFNGINTALRTIKNIRILGLTPFSNLREISVPAIPYLEGGGLVKNSGQLFVANEAGPELVANVGRKTAVMNNDQIVDSVSRGVYEAVVAAMGSSRGDQVVEAKVNDKVLFEVMVSRARQETVRTGYNPLLGGA
jgi:hypothetical protein